MQYQVTVRYGGGRQRYETYVVEAADAVEGLRVAADQIPSDIAPAVDLVELRVSVDPERRSYIDEAQG
jgi:hypothetical protein